MPENRIDSKSLAIGPLEDKLDSWKEIAAYLKRTVRTVQRWEREEGLPVHRHIHQKISTVYGCKDEIDLWWEKSRVTTPLHIVRRQRQNLGVAHEKPKRSLSTLLVAKVPDNQQEEVLADFPEGERVSKKLSRPGRIMLAVLPFENLSGDPKQDYLSDGMTEELTTQLGGLEPKKLSVIARTSVMQFKGTRQTVAKIGRILGVDYVLAGSARCAAGRVRISAQLIQVRNESHVWAKSYDRELDDLLTIENDIASGIADEVQLQLSDQQRARLNETHSPTPYAQELYLMGRYNAFGESQVSLALAISLYKRAIENDSYYASPYAGLSAAYIRMGHWSALPPEEAFEKARAAALKAIELDSSLGEAHAALGDVRFLHDWDWNGAEREYQKALSLNPSSIQTLRSYASLLIAMKRFSESTTLTRRAREIDPASVYLNAFSAVQLYTMRRYAASIKAARQTLKIDSSYSTGHLFLGLNYEQIGRHAAAVRELRRAVSSAGVKSNIAHVAHALAVSGRTKEADKILAELRDESQHSYVSPWLFAIIYCGLGDKDRAFERLEECYQNREHDLAYSNIWPQFDCLRSDRRWADLMGRIGLPS
jgi:TolB-like protein/Flp pilus assembly protein TadD